ncbi:hypothetical protein E4T42_04774 [Aureobasidium subglaciale]|uniref:Uncharacterized protein n=1 Tax=Aureobasidium subglaciale (strain EXF-2481) TaxID=1043005 RepID=A0A074Y1P0_AURSE|nr:uncharacterized protein AUEXF2481DRAFT_43986 [Aureobasidium subglaciale EXF-2481]KAI5200381.1 hypothetical protein E4T38_06592 [Aureobasidium subglaciale]KAI5218956.1 hypothetical protein E4T40_06711 [Aureobasidium subglaciale]KAI5222637.1 hypothetical protein E4T41_06532 [Aureobasidium subglaciale]KAI5250762.1 hypothetical protein E4T42_04774 [Aureobasidium subglaciale]KAI5260215.1 hypothetical protein E4T46_06244 [Aureobasidium subglaciale]
MHFFPRSLPKFALTFSTKKPTFAFACLLGAASAVAIAAPGLERRSGKPTGGPAKANVIIYAGPATCADPNTPPPTDGSAGIAKTYLSVTEDICTIINPVLGLTGAVTAVLTQGPKTGTAGCYIEMFKESGCGLTLSNQFHGWPFDGIGVGNHMGCANAVGGFSYGAVTLLCV